MDYHQVRTITVRNAYAATIRKFLENYDDSRPTVVLLPGGMGSQLDRSPKPFDELGSGFDGYNPVWLDDGILFSQDGLKLEMDNQERDKDTHMIVPNGPLRYLINAYDGTAAWAAASDFNFIVFGYDWRRPIEGAASFLAYFLGLLRSEAEARGYRNPLPQTTLLAHSQGGLVAKVFLHIVEDEPAAWMKQVVTVGTPFYGTWSHMARFYVGQSPLDILHGKKRVAEIVATLPGPYVLMFLDKEIYDAKYKQLGFEKPEDYPMVDEKKKPADPYNPANLGRFPTWIKKDYLDRSREIRKTIAMDLKPDAIARVYNMRATKEKMPVRLTWGQIPANYDPEKHPTPISWPDGEGPGDGTVPAWAAFMPQTPASHRIDLKDAKVHQDLLEHVEVLNRVGELVDPGYRPVATLNANGIYGRPANTATPGEIDSVASDAAQGKLSREDLRVHRPDLWRGIYQEMKR